MRRRIPKLSLSRLPSPWRAAHPRRSSPRSGGPFRVLRALLGGTSVVLVGSLVGALAVGVAPASAAATSASAITAGFDHTCALTSAGGVECWGANASGQLGDGTTTDSSTPVAVSGLSSGVSAIAAGSYHTCALTSTGAVKCWGYNGDGELGDSTTTDRAAPVAVTGLSSGVNAIAAGAQHTCALMSTGAVKCWGNNGYGELGDSTTTERVTPVAVTGLSSGVNAIAAGAQHSCALTSGGAVKCWGRNDYGQLGDSTTTGRVTPVAVTGLSSGVSAIATGSQHTCALTSGGAVKCWGNNGSGRLGNGTTTNSPTPVAVSGLAGVPAPSVQISTPAGGQTYSLNQTVATSFSCSDGSGAPGISTCRDSNGATSPGALVTATAGSHTYTVTATSQDGQTATASINYTVAGAPTAQITTPAGGSTYAINQNVPTSFSCTDGSHGPGISTCLDSNGATSPGALVTTTAGSHTYTVTATSQDGQTATTAVNYTVAGATVAGPPSAQISSPANGGTYPAGQRVATSFSCADGSHGRSAISSCRDSNGATSPGLLDTTTAGSHTYTVTATGQDGQTAIASITYAVAAPPDNHFTLSHVKHRADGTVTFEVQLPGTGTVDVLESASNTPHGFVFASAHITVPRAGTIHVKVVPNSRGRSLVHKKHSVLIRLSVSYTPTGGSQSTPLVAVVRITR